MRDLSQSDVERKQNRNFPEKRILNNESEYNQHFLARSWGQNKYPSPYERYWPKSQKKRILVSFLVYFQTPNYLKLQAWILKSTFMSTSFVIKKKFL